MGNKTTATFNFDNQTLEDLEEFHFEIRRLTGLKISKSLLVDVSVGLAFQDFQKKGEKSKVVTSVKTLKS